MKEQLASADVAAASFIENLSLQSLSLSLFPFYSRLYTCSSRELFSSSNGLGYTLCSFFSYLAWEETLIYFLLSLASPREDLGGSRMLSANNTALVPYPLHDGSRPAGSYCHVGLYITSWLYRMELKTSQAYWGRHSRRSKPRNTSDRRLCRFLFCPPFFVGWFVTVERIRVK